MPQKPIVGTFVGTVLGLANGSRVFLLFLAILGRCRQRLALVILVGNVVALKNARRLWVQSLPSRAKRPKWAGRFSSKM